MRLVWCTNCFNHYDASSQTSQCNGISTRHADIGVSSADAHRILTKAAWSHRTPSGLRSAQKRRTKRR